MKIGPVIVIHDADLESLAALLEGEVITAKTGSLTLDNQYADGKIVTIQRKNEGLASENLARFQRYGSTWRVLSLTEEASAGLNEVGRTGR